ncbi:DUF5662 family protein [Rhizobium sp. MHM7A]|uniref:DUF5662 family protein n=1 Tax=Rhizobium sp. MHM7A TaxID=2583233 RepID=UPI001106B293|nr:DUF5662 family protein [Rhizobium sp. MHM7A]TLX16969.1 hypothetical protein FFR93_06525 [Rhizobium sp. MHM7A]
MKAFLCICRYVFKTVRHKILVFKFGLKTGAPIWRLVIHDWTKFTPSELPHYANRFYGEEYGLEVDHLKFALAWNHHHKSNPHHAEFWIPTTTHMLSLLPAGVPLPMPEPVIREMVADWLAASTSYTGIHPTSVAEWAWFQKERANLQLHAETWRILDRVLTDYFGSPADLDSASFLQVSPAP